MKRIVILIAALIVALPVFAEKKTPVGVRMEVASASQDDNEYELFSYKDKDGTFGYYLSLGHVYRLVEVVTPNSNSSFDHVDEICIGLGSTPDEVFTSLDALLGLLEKDLGTVLTFPARVPTVIGLGEAGTATCIVVKRPLQGKRLCFQFPVRRRVAETDLTKSAINNLRRSFKFYLKLHPVK